MMPRLKLGRSDCPVSGLALSIYSSRAFAAVSLASLVIFLRTGLWSAQAFISCNSRNPIILPCVSSLNVRHAFRCAFFAAVDTMPTRLQAEDDEFVREAHDVVLADGERVADRHRREVGRIALRQTEKPFRLHSG